MQTLKYIFLAAFVFLIIKAFFLDEKIEEYKNESNQTVEENEPNATEQTNPETVERATDTKESNKSNISKNHPAYKDAPMEKLGDSVANTLDEKIKIPDRKMPGTDTDAF